MTKGPIIYRFIWRHKGELKFREGTFFDEEKNAIEACSEPRKCSKPRDIECGYLEEVRDGNE